MKKYYDEYGIASDDLDAVAKAISERLDIPLEADSDSDYGGKYYEHRSEQQGSIRLFLNWNPLLDEWVVWPLRAHPMVLQVFISPRTFEIEKALQNIEEFDIALVDRGVYDTETEKYKTEFSLVDQQEETG